MIPVSLFLAAAVQTATFVAVWICLLGDADQVARDDAKRVFFIGSLIAAGIASFYFVR